MKCTISFVCFAFFVGSINALLKPRIIGGLKADIKDFQYMASLRYEGEHFCGGVILSEIYILTAAHCLSPEPKQSMVVIAPKDLRVHTGTSYNYKETGYAHRVAELTIHPEWTGTQHNFVNDIAILKLADPIKFNERQQKVEFPNNDVVSGTKGYVIGWGCTSLKKKNNDIAQLQKLEMTILNYTDCQSRLPLALFKNQLCAYHTKGHGSCLGDSGGPLVIGNQIVGIISWIYNGLFASGIPEVLANVYTYRDFIESIIEK